MPTFNADQWLAAREPWSIVFDQKRFEAAAVSAVEVVDFQSRLAAAGEDLGAAQRAVRDFLRLLFPRRVWYRWRGDPVSRIVAMGTDGQKAVLDDFFAWLGQRYRQ